MRVFDCNQDESSGALLNYDIDGKHKWTLPGVKCPACGATWATTGIEYPSVDISNEPFAEDYKQGWPVALEELERLRSRVRKVFPEGAVLAPGTEFGNLVGSASGSFPDFVWLVPWTLLIRRDSYARLRSKNVRMPVAVAPELRLPRDKWNDLLELEIQPLCALAPVSFLPDGEPCKTCGREGREIDVPIVSLASVPAESDMFRPRNFPTYILGTERLKQAIEELELTGMVFQELDLL